MLRRATLVVVILLSVAFGPATLRAVAAPPFVLYDGSTLPGDDPQAPWEHLGRGSGTATVAEGVLTLTDPGTGSWILMHRYEPSFEQYAVVVVEVLVRVPSGSGHTGSPAIALYDFDSTRPADDIAHLWYELDLFPDRIEFNRVDNDVHPPAKTTLGTASVPDLASAFRRFFVARLQSGDGQARHFEIGLDDRLLFTTPDEPADRALDGIGFGYGLDEGAGTSEWDYVRYWVDTPVGAGAASWGGVKARYRR